MYGRDEDVDEQPREACWNLLREAEVGRLAVGVGRDLEVFPVTYRCDSGSLFFRTSPGSKLAMMTINPFVVLEIDGLDGDEAWSVVAKGPARHLSSAAELDVAEALQLTTWIPGERDEFVRIDVQEVTGRRFRRADVPAAP